MASLAVILAAAGKKHSLQRSTLQKTFAPLANKPVWLHSAERFVNRQDVQQVILVVDPADRQNFGSKFLGNAAMLGIEVVDGGAERADSVQRGVERVRPDIEYIAVHDAARPCLVDEWISTILSAAIKNRSSDSCDPHPGYDQKRQ